MSLLSAAKKLAEYHDWEDEGLASGRATAEEWRQALADLDQAIREVESTPITSTDLTEFRVCLAPDPKCPPHILELRKRDALAQYLGDLPVKWTVHNGGPYGHPVHEARIFYIRGEK